MKIGSRALPIWMILGLLFVEPGEYAYSQIRGDIDYGIGFVEPGSCSVYSSSIYPMVNCGSYSRRQD